MHERTKHQATKGRLEHTFYCLSSATEKQCSKSRRSSHSPAPPANDEIVSPCIKGLHTLLKCKVQTCHAVRCKHEQLVTQV